jgi:thiosulfate dehydrogenase
MKIFIVLLTFISQFAVAQDDTDAQKYVIPENFQANPFPDTPEGKLAAYGKLLVSETYALVGPSSNNPISGNRMACTNCHLNAGTKPFAAPYIGLSGVFPIFIGREGKVTSLEERINGCFERSLNGRAMDVNSNEMRAIVTYIKHLSSGLPIGRRLEGQGFTTLRLPARAANPSNGAVVYEKHCSTCHGSDGQGKLGETGKREGGYIFPPLWGNDSFNDGAGMARVITAAKYIKGNMPFGTSANFPVLTDEEAIDVAAFINSKPRPEKTNKVKDYPDRTKKPKDSPYPPYADSIPQVQHKYGPFNF